MNLALGNHTPLARDAGSPPPPAKDAVYITVDPEASIKETLALVFDRDGVWSRYARPRTRPRWVASENPELTAAVAARFSGIEVRDFVAPPTTLPTEPPADLTAEQIVKLVRSTVLATLAEQKGTP